MKMMIIFPIRKLFYTSVCGFVTLFVFIGIRYTTTSTQPRNACDLSDSVIEKSESNSCQPNSDLKKENVNNSGIEIMNLDEIIDKAGPQIQKWVNDPECSNFTVYFAKRNTIKPRALVSFPGSGNTWVRHLIESSTGLFTGSLYNDKRLFQSGYLGERREPDDGTTILQKTHRGKAETSESLFKYRGILIIRNPYDAILSYWNLYVTGSLTGHAMPSSFFRTAWKIFVEEGSKSWGDLIEIWIKKSTDLHVVEYEELKANTERELLGMLQYLKQPNDTGRVKCTLKHKEGSYHRIHIKNKLQARVESPYMRRDVSGKSTLSNYSNSS